MTFFDTLAPKTFGTAGYFTEAFEGRAAEKISGRSRRRMI